MSYKSSSNGQHSHSNNTLSTSPATGPINLRPVRARSSSKSNPHGKLHSSSYGGQSKFDSLFGGSAKPGRAGSTSGTAQPHHAVMTDEILDEEMDRLIDEEDARLAAEDKDDQLGAIGHGRKEILRCERCHKVYHHPQSLIKHRWQHTSHWSSASQYGLSKHQTVQALEAAVILANADTGASHFLPEDKSHWPAAVSPPTSGLLGSDRMNIEVLRRRAALQARRKSNDPSPGSQSAVPYSQSVPTGLHPSGALAGHQPMSNGSRRSRSRGRGSRNGASGEQAISVSLRSVHDDENGFELDEELEAREQALSSGVIEMQEEEDNDALDNDDDDTEDEDDSLGADVRRVAQSSNGGRRLTVREDSSMDRAASALGEMHLAASPFNPVPNNTVTDTMTAAHNLSPGGRHLALHDPHTREVSQAGIPGVKGDHPSFPPHMATANTLLSVSAPVLGFFEDSHAANPSARAPVDGGLVVSSPLSGPQLNIPHTGSALAGRNEPSPAYFQLPPSIVAPAPIPAIAPISLRSPVLSAQLLGGNSPRLPSSLGRSALSYQGTRGYSTTPRSIPFGQAPIAGSYRSTSASQSIGQVLHGVSPLPHSHPENLRQTKGNVLHEHKDGDEDSVAAGSSAMDDDDLMDMDL